MPLSNLTPETAIEIKLSELPYTNTQNVFDGGVINEVYYKITNDLDLDGLFCIWFRGQVPNNYTIQYSAYCIIYNDILLDDYLIDPYPNCACQLPIKKSESYWIKVTNEGSAVASPTLFVDISLKIHSNTIPAGQIVIFGASTNDPFIEKGGLNTGFIDPNTGAISNHIPFYPTTDFGDVRNDGVFLFADNSHITQPPPAGDQDYHLLLTNPDFEITNRIIFPGPLVGYNFEPMIRTNNATNKFWIGSPGYSGAPNRYANVGLTRSLSTIVNLPNFIGVNSLLGALTSTNDESFLLIAPNNTSTNAIHKWNLNTLTWDGYVGPAIPGYRVSDLLTMSDNSIVATIDSADRLTTIVRRYDLAGNILNTVTIPLTAEVTAKSRLGYSATASVFWSWIPQENGETILRKFNLSDFSIIIDHIIINVYQTMYDILEPALEYVSDCCPIIEIRVPAPNPNRSGSTIHLVKTVNPSDDPTKFNFNIINMSPATVQLGHGEFHDFTVPPGNGYRITEVLIPGFETTHTVSNGSPITNISIEPDEFVTVEFTNSKQNPVGTGIYFINPTKVGRHDSYYTSEERKIPNPTIKTAILGE